MIAELGKGLSPGLISFLTSSRPGHTRMPSCALQECEAERENPTTAPLSSELWHHTAYPLPTRERKPLGLNP